MEQVIEKRIVIHAKAETVYKALTEARYLARWFANRAESRPVEGGSILLMWGGGDAAEGVRAVFSRLTPGREVWVRWVMKLKPGEQIPVTGIHENGFLIDPSPEGVIVTMREQRDTPPSDADRMRMDQEWDQTLVSLKSLCEGPDAPQEEPKPEPAMAAAGSGTSSAAAKPKPAAKPAAKPAPKKAAKKPAKKAAKKPAKKAKKPVKKAAKKSAKKVAKKAKKPVKKAVKRAKPKAARKSAKKAKAKPKKKTGKKSKR